LEFVRLSFDWRAAFIHTEIATAICKVCELMGLAGVAISPVSRRS
jgi:hypothetical protein